MGVEGESPYDTVRYRKRMFVNLSNSQANYASGCNV